jgi:hypothetical protein
MSTRLNWRLLLGEFIVIVVGILMALWVDQLREARVHAELEVEYLESLVIDLEADLAQFDETEAWMRRSEVAAATVLALYEGSPPTQNAADLVAAVEIRGLAVFALHHSKHDRRSEVDRESSPDPRSGSAQGDRLLLRDCRKRQHPQCKHARSDVGTV